MKDKPPKIHKINLEGIIYNMGFRVVTEDMKSLGLRQNPNIVEYVMNEWLYLPSDQVTKGNDDWGGYWVARTPSGAKSIQKYMLNKHNTSTRVFEAAIDEILYVNSYRIKTNGIYLTKEIKL